MVNYGQLFPGRNETRTSAKLAGVWRGTGGKSATMETRFDGGESGRYNIERKPSIRESVLCLQRRSHQKANVFPDREVVATRKTDRSARVRSGVRVFLSMSASFRP
jgi:hypothetical protein